jgi:hypothetical protein
MKKTTWLGVIAAVATATLAFATAAFAAYSPTMAVSRHLDVQSGTTTTDLTLSQTDAEDPAAGVVIFAPAGYTATLNQSPGTQIGTVEGSAVLFGAAATPVTGTLTVGDKSSALLIAAAQKCTGTATHDAIWLMNITAAGIPATPIPAYVDVAKAPLTSYASLSVRLCLKHPSEPPNVKLLSVTVHLSPGVLAPPATPGAYRWTAVHVPYNPTTPVINVAEAIQTQSIDRTAVSASFAAKRVTKTRRVKTKRGITIFYTYFARLTGQASVGGQAAAGATVDILAGKNKVGTATTNSSGSFATTVKLTKTTAFQAQFTQSAAAVSGATCIPTIPFMGTNLRCGHITQGGFTATSQTVALKKPKLTVRHIKTKKKKKNH